MAYNSSSGLPMERASKIAHMEIIRDESIIELLQSFRSMEPPSLSSYAPNSDTVDLSVDSPIKYVVTIDGGLSVVPNPVRRDKALAFIQVGTCFLKLEDIDRMKVDRMMDPRELSDILKKIAYRPAVLPLAGISRPHMTVKETIRHAVNSILSPAYSNQYWILDFLVFRKWLPEEKVEDRPSMDCYACGEQFEIPYGQTIFRCPVNGCKHEHFLSDYLQIANSGSDDWSKEDAAKAMMSVMEHLAALEVPIMCARDNKLEALEQFLFIKDGPLLLRAALSRLVEPIRELIAWINAQGAQLNLIGVEKTGDFSNYIVEHKKLFSDENGDYIPGTYFLPNIRYLLEEVTGQVYNETTYRNRVNYGAKVGVALSRQHLVVLNVPTGQFLTEPKKENLIGFDQTVVALSGLVSSSYENAIIPLILANQAVSISYEPSGTILKQFVDEILSKS
jgi:hypothetical protein